MVGAEHVKSMRTVGLFFLLAIMVGGLMFVVKKEYGEYLYIKEHTVASLEETEGLPTFQIHLMNADFRLKEKKEHRLKEDKPQLKREAKSWIVRHGDQDMGKLSYEGMWFKTTGDYYYFLCYEPMATYGQPIILQASIASAAHSVTGRHLVYPPVPESLSPFSIGNSTWTEPFRLGNEGGLPKHSLYLEAEDFSFHANMINSYEPLAMG